MLDLGVNYAENACGDLKEDLQNQIKSILKEYITKSISFEECCHQCHDLIGKDDPIHRIRDIIELPEEPIPYHEENESEESSGTSNRKKTRTWTIAEDQRLLAGVYHFGVDNWQAVAQFLGSGRNRAQCSQRWTRGLNPRISKKSWTEEEDQQLVDLVKTYGQKSWTKISSIMGKRSDVQCRYRYKQILSGKVDSPPESDSDASHQNIESPQHIPLNKRSKLTMSSEALVAFKPPKETIKPSPLNPSDSSDDPISLSSQQFSVSTPSFILTKPLQKTGLMYGPILPISPRRPILVETCPSKAPQCSWGTCGVGPQELHGFLSHFNY